MFITKLICLWVQGRAYIRNHKQGNVSRECAWTLWGRAFAGECMQAHRHVQRDWVTCHRMTRNASGLKCRGVRLGLGVAQGWV